MRIKRIRPLLRATASAGGLCLLIALPLAAHTGLIVDTDMGLDDVRAIFAILSDPSVDLRAFITVEGSAALGKGTDNLIGLLESVHAESTLVILGYRNPDLGPPPWRPTADGLGGAAFPPPRRVSAVEGTAAYVAEMLEQPGATDYLALGPLGNLHMLEQGVPGSLARIDEIWIPAHVRDDRISGWNLLYDVAASQTVFAHAHKVILIDIPEVADLDASALLSALAGDSPPVRWIADVLSGAGGQAGHLMLHDELAAAAILNHDLIQVDQQTYAVSISDGQGFTITPMAGGNVTVARFKDHESALSGLKHLWEHGPSSVHPAEHEDVLPADVLLKSFHGHLGPYVVIGYRMGKLALEELRCDGHFGISAAVHSPLAPPSSCLIDGVQIGSGCTLGKRNIEIYDYAGPAWATFASDRGDEVTIRLRPAIPAVVEDLVNTEGVEAAGQEVFQLDLDSLFTVVRRTH